ncbi:MAG: DapH/DapD/GlmU-related protein [Calditrichia bacterium]
MGNDLSREHSEAIHAEEKVKKVKIDVYAKTSSLTGFAGLFESAIRRFRTFAFIFVLIPIYFLACLCVGISLIPAFYLNIYIYKSTLLWPAAFHFAGIGFGLMAGYLLYGFALIFVVPFFNYILPFKVKPMRGSYFSLEAIPWFVHNALTYLVRYTFLEFITPTPFNILFYRMMGMKIGKNVFLNTTRISDPCLITIEDNVTVGGSATLIAHSASAGYLIVAPVHIRKGATIGLSAIVMGDVVIGENAKIQPGVVVLPKSRIPASEKNKGK